MDYSIHRTARPSTEALADLHTDCLVVGVFANGELTPSAAVLDHLSGGMLTRLITRGDLEMAAGKTLLIPTLSGVMKTERVLLVCLGFAAELNLKRWKSLFSESLNALQQRGIKRVDFALLEAAPQSMSQSEALRHAVLALDETSYRFVEFKSDKTSNLSSVQHAAFLASMNEAETLETALQQAIAIAAGVLLTKNLANTPGNVCTPSYLAQTARQLAASAPQLGVEV
ncbi:MAG: M17 family peptidase N-terminal domain-containing protein [Halothiobacillaceae bacterium]